MHSRGTQMLTAGIAALPGAVQAEEEEEEEEEEVPAAVPGAA